MAQEGEVAQDGARPPTAAETLAQWREAERLASVARRGKEAAQAAALAAEDAAAAALATAEAARAALAAAKAADESAQRTAESARLVVDAARADIVMSTAHSDQADVDEAAAHGRYDHAVEDARRRQDA
jgi:hypothetical protein